MVPHSVYTSCHNLTKVRELLALFTSWGAHCLRTLHIFFNALLGISIILRLMSTCRLTSWHCILVLLLHYSPLVRILEYPVFIITTRYSVFLQLMRVNPLLTSVRSLFRILCRASSETAVSSVSSAQRMFVYDVNIPYLGRFSLSSRNMIIQ